MTVIEETLQQFKEKMKDAYGLLRDATFAGGAILIFAFDDMQKRIFNRGIETLIGICGFILSLFATALFIASISLLSVGMAIYATLQCLFLPIRLIAADIEERLTAPEEHGLSLECTPLEPSTLLKTPLPTVDNNLEEQESSSEDEHEIILSPIPTNQLGL